MNCLVKGFPKLEVNWTRYGKLPDTTNKLTIKQVTFKDAGQYTCSAKNSEGKNEASFYFFSSSYSFHFLFFFFKLKWKEVLIYINEKKFWFIIETNVQFFFFITFFFITEK